MLRFAHSKVMILDPTAEQVKQFKMELKMLWDTNPNNPNHSNDESSSNFKQLCQNQQEEFLCGICYKDPCNALITPCNHCEICIECSKTSFGLKDTCPFCRQVNNSNNFLRILKKLLKLMKIFWKLKEKYLKNLLTK